MIFTNKRCRHGKGGSKPRLGTGWVQGGSDEAVFSSVGCRARQRAVRRSRFRPGSAGAHDPLGSPQQHRSSRQLRRAKVRGNPAGQERRQDEGARVCLVAARQRTATTIGAARWHPGDAVSLDHVARDGDSGIRPARFSVYRQHHRSGRRAGAGRLRQGDDRRVAGARAGRARLLGSRLP